MSSAPVEVVVVDWDGPADALAAGLAQVLALGIDVVTTQRLPSLPDGAGRVFPPPGSSDPVDWAYRQILGRGAPYGAVAVVRDQAGLDAVIAARGGFPEPVTDPAWRLDVEGHDPAREREVESWLTVGNGRTGTRGALEEGGPQSSGALYVAGLYGQDPAGQAGPELVPGPEWTHLDVATPPTRRVLDLRQGVLFREGEDRSARFASLADRRVLAMEAVGDGWGPAEVPLPPTTGPAEIATAEVDPETGVTQVRVQGRGDGAAHFAITTRAEPGRIRRVVTVDREGDATGAAAVPDDLPTHRARHVHAWRERWRGADVVVDNDAKAQHALRFALYHLIATADPESDRASVGARALTGPGYRGHVFWDTEIFVLPFFVWTHPQTARALLAYRYRTLPAARAKAARLGYEGALYAWESANTGEETTPEHVYLPDGVRLDILTGIQEHHIAADVAWGVVHYWQVTGDDAFLEEMGAEIVVETARFWASRAAPGDDGRFHIRTVIGPDEYHEGVDDNAYTNVLARWNLRAAGQLCDRLRTVAARLGVDEGQRRRWEEVAGGLVDGFDPETLLYEQFDGFFDLDPARAVDLAPRPFTGELVVGVEQLRRSQIVKQADVLLLGVLLPDEVGDEVQAANYRHYEPLTSHGSSLSPAMHALVAARVDDVDDALWYFHLAGGVDLDNRMGNAADGVHIATMGGLWQAAVMGFGGARADGDRADGGGAVRIDPRLPPAWEVLSFTVTWRGSRLTVEVRAGALVLDLDGPADVALGRGPASRLEAGHHAATMVGGGWSWVGQP